MVSLKKKKLVITTSIIIVILLASLIGISNYFYNLAVARSGPKDFLNNNPDLELSSGVTLRDEGKKWLDKTQFDEIIITSNDDLKLKGYYFEAKVPTNKTVIIAHGYTGEAKDMARFAKFYQEKLGYNVLMPDARGHGDSEGDYIGFGWHERKDYVQWINYIIEKKGKDSEILLHGVSMGGATVLMTSGENLPKQVKAIVEDCGYTSAEGVLEYQLKRMYNLSGFPIVNSTSMLTKLKAGYTFSEASALEQVKKAKLPIMFIHGEKDTFVPFEMVYELYEAANTEKELYVVPDAEHANAYDIDPALYEEKVINFVTKYIK